MLSRIPATARCKKIHCYSARRLCALLLGTWALMGLAAEPLPPA